MQIHRRHPHQLGDAEREAIQDKLRRLAEGHTDLIDVWIDVESSSDHHRSGDEYVTLRASVRGGQIIAHADGAHIEIALRNALDTFTRNVCNQRERRGGRRHTESVRGQAREEASEDEAPTRNRSE